MNCKYRWFFSILIVLILVCSFSSCTKSGIEDSEETSGIENQIDPNAEVSDIPEGEGISFEEELDGAVIERKKADVSEFVGNWVATSDKAAFMYGNVTLSVNSNGTWLANITDEKLEGTWEKEGDCLHMNNSMFSFDLAFDKGGNLIMIEHFDGGSDLYTVLTRQ